MAIYWLHICNEVINSLIKYKVSIFDKRNHLRKHKKSNKNVWLIIARNSLSTWNAIEYRDV